jgi:cyclic pyranopterin phosphate synthase
MPKEIYGRDYAFLERSELLTFEEITRLARIAVGLGVKKIRLTGGEPLLRRNIERLVGSLAELQGLDLALTTNGSALATKSEALVHAGLERVTVSLDALDDERFMALNDVAFPVGKVLEGIDQARRAGLSVKVNAVVKRGVNEDALVPMVEHFRGTGVVVRFIEYMDVGSTNGWKLDDVVPAAEMVERLSGTFPLEPVEPGYRGEVAERYRLADGTGEVGIIASVTRPFCRDCTRARLSAEGMLFTCLFAATGHDMRALLRSDASNDEIAAELSTIWTRRSDRYSEIRTEMTSTLPKVEMSYIGG